MIKICSLCLLIGIFTLGCAGHVKQKQAPVTDTAAASANQQKPDDSDNLRSSDKVPVSNWQPFKGVLLRHIVANCCFSDSQNTVILGQDNNRDQRVDKCYQLKGREGKLYYRTIECPDNLAPVKAPRQENKLQCNLL